MAELPIQTLRVLQSALELQAFTMPQLTMESEASYETVKQVLRSEEGHTLQRTGEKTTGGVGRPAEVWEVIDATAIKERLTAAEETLKQALEKKGAQNQSETVGIPQADLYLAHAEDKLVFALQAEDPDDAGALAEQALAALSEADIAVAPWDQFSATVALVDELNLKARDARALIVESVAKYIRSNEAGGLEGPLWRHAFRLLASVELQDQAALHRRFLVDLVRVADQRAGLHRTESLPHADLVDLLRRAASEAKGGVPCEKLVSSLQSESQLGREALKAALAQVVGETAESADTVDWATSANLSLLVRAAFPRGSEAPEEELKALVGGLCALAISEDEEVAADMQETLLAIHQPRQVTFWRRLPEASKAASHQIAFVGLSHISLEEAFAYLRDLLAGSTSVEEVRNTLIDGLPRVDLEAQASAQEHFAEFLASISAEDRRQLVAVPTLAGLDWPVPRFEQLLVRRFFAVLTRWRMFVHSQPDDDRVIAQRDALGRELEIAAAEALPLLDAYEQRSLGKLLATDIHQPEAAAVCVPLMLSLGLEVELARSLFDSTTADDEAWAYVTAWYFEVCPREKLDSAQRRSLVNALLASSAQSASTLLIGLAGRAAALQEELRELTDNPELDSRLRVKLEMGMTDSYGTSAQVLEAVVTAYGASAP